jgi:proline racemase
MDWNPPDGSLKIAVVDMHAAGEPLRVISEGFPELPGGSILLKRRFLQENYDFLRRSVLWEPRGHRDMYGALLTEKERPDSDFGAIFMHNEGYGTMCGHGIIGLVTLALETGLAEVKGDRPIIKIDTAAGQVIAGAVVENGRVSEVSFRNVPSFAYALGRKVDVPGLGSISIDIAFGGAFYAVCQAADVDVDLVPNNYRRLVDLGMRIKEAATKAIPVRHPIEEDLSFLFGTIIVGPAMGHGCHSRNVCIFANGEVDRSPTGTGVSARAALLYSRGEIRPQETFIVESMLGTRFKGKIMEITTFGPYSAVITEVAGSANITGRAELFISPGDPLKNGFLLG